MIDTTYTPQKLWHAKQDIDLICRPLNQFDISYFAHVHLDENGCASGISNNPGYSEHYIKNKFYNVDINMAKKDIFGNFFLWDLIDGRGKTNTLIKTAAEFGIKHTFTIIENNRDYYHFATHLDSNLINQTYLANFDLLKLFILHFKNEIKQSKSLLSIYDFALTPEPDSTGFTITSDIDKCNNINKRAEFISNLSINLDLIDLKSINLIKNLNLDKSKTFKASSMTALTMREKECLNYYIQGKTAKDIASILQLSYRTVENYLQNAKDKIGVNNKLDLIIQSISIT